MKILHVVTMISPDGAYGGPTRVALNHAGALIERGHDLTVVGTHRGFDELPTEQQGVPVKLFAPRRLIPCTGFAGLSSPTMYAWARTRLRGFDLVQVHLARDLVTLPLALLALKMGIPLVLQTHGMIIRHSRLSARLLDTLVTRRVLREAHRVLYLTPMERDELRAVARGQVDLAHLPNGVPRTSLRAEGGSDVLFLARLAERKRPMDFARAAVELHRRWPDLQFSVVGPDEGELAELQNFIAQQQATDYLSYEGPVDPADALTRLARAGLYVLPSVDEPFPMSVLEAMSLGLPVVVTDTCGLADVVRSSGAGVVTNGSVEELVAAIEGFYQDPESRRTASENALRISRETFDMTAVIDRLLGIYHSAPEFDGSRP